MVDLNTLSLEEIGKHMQSLPRKDLKTYCASLSIKELHKVILGMINNFDFEAKTFEEKENKSAGLRSRKITADLQTVFLEWRKKSIGASKIEVKAPEVKPQV